MTTLLIIICFLSLWVGVGTIIGWYADPLMAFAIASFTGLGLTFVGVVSFIAYHFLMKVW